MRPGKSPLDTPIAAGVSLVVGLVVGVWSATAIAACGGAATCHVSWDGVSAVGTWVGGLGTVVAVLVAARSFQHQQDVVAAEQRTSAMQRMAAAQRLESDALKVSVEVRPFAYSADQLTDIKVTVRNGSYERKIFDVNVDAAWLKQGISYTVIEPTGTRETYVDWEGEAVSQVAAVRVADKLMKEARLSFVMDDQVWIKESGTRNVTRSDLPG